MGYAVGTFSGRTTHELRLYTQLASQSIEGNYSTINWQLYIFRNASSSYGTWSLTPKGSSWTNIGGNVWNGGAYTYDTRNTDTILLGSGSFNVGHNPDGTGSYGLSAASDSQSTLGSASCSSSEGLPTIPRATQPTVSPTSGETGATYTIGHSPASSSFVHDVFYSLNGGSTYTIIASQVPGTDTSTSWTPAHSLLPSSTSVTAIIAVNTFSSAGGSYIGQKTVNLPLTVPASVKPTISSVAWADSQTASPDIPTMMGGTGRFVQRWSKLQPTVTSAGAGGSTVVSSNVTQNGQTTPSGTAFPSAVALSGAVPYSAVVTDTRGRASDAYTNTVAVTAYNFPNLPTPTVQRTSDAAGNVPSPTGTYLAITPLASVSSLMFGGVEKNLLEWQVRTKPKGGTYTTKQAWTSSTVSGNTWTTKYVTGGYASNTEWVVEVSIRDVFGKNGYNTTQTVTVLEIPVSSEAVFMDWDGMNGIGLGHYRTQGMLDVLGAIYQNNGRAVVDETSITPILNGVRDTFTGVIDTTWNGMGATCPVVLDSGQSDSGTKTATCNPWNYELGPSVKVIVSRIGGAGGTWWVDQAFPNYPTYPKQIPLKLQNGWGLYDDIVGDPQFGPTRYQPAIYALNSAWGGVIYASMSRYGIVRVHGLLQKSSAAGNNTVIATLPVGMRPTNEQMFTVINNGTSAEIAVRPDGNIIWTGLGTAVAYCSLNSIRFRAKSAVDLGLATFTPLVPYVTGFAEYTGAYYAGGLTVHTPGYTKDADGVVIFEGALVATTAYTANTLVGRLTDIGFNYPQAAHILTYMPGVTYTSFRFGTNTATPLTGTQGINFGWSLAAGQYAILSHASLVDPGSATTPTLTSNGQSGWNSYGQGWRLPSFAVTPDHQVFLFGLWTGGTMGSPMQSFRPGSQSRYSEILATIAADAIARVDTREGGSVAPSFGSTAWFTLDGVDYAAYQ
jgi:hypothetical protein